MIWSRMASTMTLLESVEKKRGMTGIGKHRVVADAKDFLAVMKVPSCRASHRRDFDLPHRAEYKGAMVWARPGMK